MSLPTSIIEKVVYYLQSWNYNLERSSPFNIAMTIGCSEAAVVKALRILKFKGIVKKSMGGSWVLVNMPIIGGVASAIHEETK